jgi:hypothetical protein
MQNVATHFVSIQTFLQHFQNPSLFSKHDCWPQYTLCAQTCSYCVVLTYKLWFET